MKIGMLVLDGVFDTGLFTMLDTFSTANELAETAGVSDMHFEVSLIGLRKKIISAQGIQIPVLPASSFSADVVIVPALGYKTPDTLQPALNQPDIQKITKLLNDWARKDTLLAAACTATFVLAKSGLLDNLSATTSWWLGPFFRQLFPNVTLDETRMVIHSGRIITAGAALGHIDLALSIVRKQSPQLAEMVAKYLIVDDRPSQSAYIIPDHLNHSDPIVQAFEGWARENMGEGFSLDEAASAIATSKRTLIRRMHQILGKTPLAYFQDLRVQQAIHLLRTTSFGIEQIASAVGYEDGVTLRNLLKRKLGYGIKEIRQRKN